MASAVEQRPGSRSRSRQGRSTSTAGVAAGAGEASSDEPWGPSWFSSMRATTGSWSAALATNVTVVPSTCRWLSELNGSGTTWAGSPGRAAARRAARPS